MLRLNLARRILLAATIGELTFIAVPYSTPGSQCYADDTHTPNDTLVLRLTDPNGNPVSGAKVGSFTNWSDTRPAPGRALMRCLGRSNATISSKDGTVRLDVKRLFRNSRADRIVPLYAYHENRKIGKVLGVSRKDLGTQIDLKLEPTCYVKGKILSSDLKQMGQPLEWTNAYVYWGDLRPFSSASTQQHFQFHLPQGQYQIKVYGEGTQQVRQELSIEPGQKDLELQIDLPASRVRQLLGRPAPELQKIKGWINSPPQTLNDLLGKVVLLDFWGFWCSPCIKEMPKLFELYEQFHDQGLAIIGVHNDTLDSIEALQGHLKRLEQEVWGQAMPFPVALDGGGETEILGTENTAAGATNAAYGVAAYPTTLLIDREGVIVRKFNVHGPNDIAALKRLLGEESREKAFRQAYSLEAGAVLKRVDPSFVPLRQECAGIDGFGDSYQVFRWSNGLHIQEDRPRLTSLTEPVTLRHVLEELVGLFDYEYECPEEVSTIEMSGDWLVRIGTSKSQQLLALEQIIQDYTGNRVHFERHSIKRDVIVARGKFHFNPLPIGTYNDSWVHVFSDTLDTDESWGGGGGLLHKFLDRLAKK